MRYAGSIAGVALLPWLLTAQPAGRQIALRRYPADHIAISVPVHWVEIPKSELEQMSASIREAAPRARPQPYSYGFQATAETPFPRVLVQVKTSGRWAETVFAELPKLPSLKDDLPRQVGEIGPSFARLNLQVNQLTYDPVRKLAWLRMQFTGENGQPLAGISGLYPTNVGSIQVNCQTSQADFNRFEQLFGDVISSVQIDDELRYRERNALSRALGTLPELGTSALTGAIGGMAGVLLVRFLRRRKKADKAADPSAL